GTGTPSTGCLKRSLPLQQSRVRVVEPAVNRVGREIAEVFLIQFAERADQRARLVHNLRGEGVRFIFVTTRPPVGQWRKPERHHAGQQAEQQERRRQSPWDKTETPAEPVLSRQDGKD